MAKKFYIQTKEKSCLPLDSWITKLEMRAFGWKCKGDHTEYEDTYDIDIDWDNNTAKARRRFNVYTTFKRIKPYGNIFLKIWEFFMTIQSWIRRKLIVLFFGIVLLGLGAGLLMMFVTDQKEEGTKMLMACLYIVLTIYLPSLFYALMGFLTRVVFRLDKRVKDKLEANGYSRDQHI